MIMEAIVDSITKSKADLEDRIDELSCLLREKNVEYDELYKSHECLDRILCGRDADNLDIDKLSAMVEVLGYSVVKHGESYTRDTFNK